MGIVDRVGVSPDAFHVPTHGDQHPPGQVYWSWLGTLGLGRNLVGYRFASVLLGTLAIFLIAELGRRGAGATAGLVAAFLLATNEYHIAASSLCTEKTHLTFGLAALLAFRSTLASPTLRHHVYLGAALGLALLTKQSIALWVPVFGVFLLAEAGGVGRLKSREVALGLLVLLVLTSPDLVYNLTARGAGPDPSARGLGFQVERLGFGGWSWGPLALFVRPLVYHRAGGALSEYPAMTTLPGLVVLLGALVGGVTDRDRWNRFLVLLGFGTLLFFALATAPGGEFWWADLALLPLTLAAATAIARIPRRVGRLARVALLALLVPAVRVAADAEHVNAFDWGEPPPRVREQYQNGMRAASVQHPDRDMVALLSAFGGRLPARKHHVAWLQDYREFLDNRAGRREFAGFPRVPRAERAERLAWVDAEIARFEGRPPGLEAAGSGAAPPTPAKAVPARPEKPPIGWRPLRARDRRESLSPEQLEALKKLESLSYVSGSRPAASETGILRHDPERTSPGLNFYTSGHGPVAVLMDADGNVLHEWRRPFESVWPDLDAGKQSNATHYFRRARLLENGDVLVIFEGLGMMRLDRDSNVRWAKANGAHHDLRALADGRILVLTREAVMTKLTREGNPLLEEYLVELDGEGEELRRVSLSAAIEASEFRELADRIRTRTGDVLHTNTVHMLDGRLAERIPAFRAGNVLTSFRNLDLLAVLDVEAEKIVWILSGKFHRQHDPRILPAGTLLLFDNGAGQSRVRELDPVTGAGVWQYRGTEERPFFSQTCGSAVRLPNGNTLIVESDAGRAFEVTAEREIVWEFLNSARAGDEGQFVAALFDLERIPPSFPLDWLE